MDVLLDVFEHGEYQNLFDVKRKPTEIPFYFIATDEEVSRLSKQAQAYLRHYYVKAGDENNYVCKVGLIENQAEFKQWGSLIFVDGDKKTKKKLISYTVVPAAAEHGGKQLSYKLDDGKSYHLHDLIINRMSSKFSEIEPRVNARDKKLQNR